MILWDRNPTCEGTTYLPRQLRGAVSTASIGVLAAEHCTTGISAAIGEIDIDLLDSTLNVLGTAEGKIGMLRCRANRRDESLAANHTANRACSAVDPACTAEV